MELVYNIRLKQILEPLRLRWWRGQRIYTNIPNAAIIPLHVWVGVECWFWV